eukprot:760219-Hanusia_phi.AAC.1
MKFVEYEIIPFERGLVRRPKEDKIDLQSTCVCCRGANATVEEEDALFTGAGPWKVLYFADSPEGSALEVEKERDFIREEFFKGAASRRDLDLRELADKVSFEYCFHKDITEITTSVNQLQPVVLHLACHGSKAGSISIGGKEMRLKELVEGLSAIVNICRNLRLVVLNLCWSGTIALELRPHVDFVIGHEMAVKDSDALAFSKKLYYWMGANASLREAVSFSRPACLQCHVLARTEELMGVVSWMTRGEGEQGLGLKKSLSSPREVMAQMATHADNLKTQVNGFQAFIALCQSDQPQVDRWKEGAIAVVLKGMRRHMASEATQEEGYKALVTLLRGEDERRLKTMVEEGGIETVIAGMGRHDRSAGVQEQGCTLLNRISCQDLEVARMIMEGGGLEAMTVGIRNHPGSEGVQSQGLAVLGNLTKALSEMKDSWILSQGWGNAAATIGGGGEGTVETGRVQASGREVDEIELIEMPLLRVDGCAPLAADDWNCSEKLVSCGVIGVVVDGMHRLLASAGVQEHGCRVLSNLSALGEPDYSGQIMEKGGSGAVIMAMRRHGELAEIQDHGCRALEHLAAKSLEYCRRIVGRDGIDAVIAGMQKNASSARVQERGCWCLRALALGDRSSCDRVVERGAVESIISAMCLHLESASVQEGACKVLTALACGSREGIQRMMAASAVDVVIDGMKAHLHSSRLQVSGFKLLVDLNCGSKIVFNSVAAVIAGMEANGDAVEVQIEGFKSFNAIFDSWKVDRRDMAGAVRTRTEWMRRSLEVVVHGMQKHTNSLVVQTLGCQVLSRLCRSEVMSDRADIALSCIQVVIVAVQTHPNSEGACHSGSNVLAMLSRANAAGCERILEAGGVQAVAGGIKRFGYSHSSVALLRNLYRMGPSYRAAIRETNLPRIRFTILCTKRMGSACCVIALSSIMFPLIIVVNLGLESAFPPERVMMAHCFFTTILFILSKGMFPTELYLPSFSTHTRCLAVTCVVEFQHVPSESVVMMIESLTGGPMGNYGGEEGGEVMEGRNGESRSYAVGRREGN